MGRVVAFGPSASRMDLRGEPLEPGDRIALGRSMPIVVTVFIAIPVGHKNARICSSMGMNPFRLTGAIPVGAWPPTFNSAQGLPC